MSEFVRASRLYDIESQSPIAHPAHQASDADVRQALEDRDDREIRADGGTDLSGTAHSRIDHLQKAKRFATMYLFDVHGARSVEHRRSHTVAGVKHHLRRTLQPDTDEDDDREIRTDGGTDLSSTEREASSSLFDRWMGKASENIEEWGLQDEETLLLAIQEELGELTQAHLEATHEDGDPDRVSEELDDLGALLLQLHESHNNRTPQSDTDENDDREIRTDGGTSSSERCIPVTIDGARVPAMQIDRFDGDVIVNVDVASAVSEGFDFSGIWRCKRVTVSIGGREFAATITACSVEHGIAAIRLADCETFGPDDTGDGDRGDCDV